MGLFDVTQFGASDGETDHTEMMTQAVKACADAGGGTVYVPAGVYRTGPIELCII
ncbi:hypothetical protein J416_10406 [Gracilibacillus halophilus YIM-C55.5]|uniref:Rhamnogalacturonase A/B/Epimerase-like pectate lyase domain-containing protein n=1 Tax=Gracilibacillus halophilus YIM-C55.5 TaxID=1308866 RepID=N4WTP4_9BACI|nr:glycosyl hydrolase family 28-related protein [Gracilibacillus halophilus]ENH96501.1 hypothetical protein J416_10406 [Gracilibacillus halophilus YIM-C55.5]